MSTQQRSPMRSTVDPNKETGGPLYILNCLLQSGRQLAIKDASGSSDPYVKFFYKDKLIYRSHTIFNSINPDWNEKFVYIIDDVHAPLRIEVYDYDRFSDDDFMGWATVDLLALDERPSESKVVLIDKKDTGKDLGYLILRSAVASAKDEAAQTAARARLSSQEESPTKDKLQGIGGVRKSAKMHKHLVHITLVEAKLTPITNPLAGDAPDTYVKFKLGNEKAKSKIVYKSLRPSWLEQFSLHIQDEVGKILEVAVMDLKKDAPVGKCAIDLSLLRPGQVEKRWYQLDNGVSEILLTLSHTGKLATRTVSTADKGDGLSAHFDEEATPELVNKTYDMKKTFKNIWDIGHLTVKVIKARNLPAKDIGNSSDPFVVCELVNARMETHTIPKTKNPEWNTIFTFYVADIHTCLEVTVYDEDRYMKSELIGKVSIPLLNIKNNEHTWYPLRNDSLHHEAKGEILLECNLNYNPVRAVIATFLPPEKKYGMKDDPFKIGRFIKHLERLNRFWIPFHDLYKYWQLCLSWESPQRSVTVFMILLMSFYYFHPCFIPLGVLALFGYVYIQRLSSLKTTGRLDIPDEPGETEFEIEYTDDKENWRYVRRYLQEKNISLSWMQNFLDLTVSLLEKAKNILEFKQPFVSWIAIGCMVVGFFLFLLIPLKYIAMAWVIKKFTRKLRRPHAVPSNEIFDFICRAPSDQELRMYHGYK